MTKFKTKEICRSLLNQTSKIWLYSKKKQSPNRPKSPSYPRLLGQECLPCHSMPAMLANDWESAAGRRLKICLVDGSHMREETMNCVLAIMTAYG